MSGSLYIRASSLYIRASSPADTCQVVLIRYGGSSSFYRVASLIHNSTHKNLFLIKNVEDTHNVLFEN